MMTKRPSGLLVPDDRIRLGGIFIGKILRDGKVIDEFESRNLVTNQGLDYLLSTGITAGAQTSSWFLAPFKGNYQPVATDTGASISANSTESTEYTSTTRIAYQGVEANQQVTNANAPGTFTFNASVTVYGAFIVSASGKQSTSGTLLAASLFSTSKNLSNGDQLLLTYSISATAS